MQLRQISSLVLISLDLQLRFRLLSLSIWKMSVVSSFMFVFLIPTFAFPANMKSSINLELEVCEFSGLPSVRM